MARRRANFPFQPELSVHSSNTRGEVERTRPVPTGQRCPRQELPLWTLGKPLQRCHGKLEAWLLLQVKVGESYGIATKQTVGAIRHTHVITRILSVSKTVATERSRREMSENVPFGVVGTQFATEFSSSNSRDTGCAIDRTISARTCLSTSQHLRDFFPCFGPSGKSSGQCPCFLAG